MINKREKMKAWKKGATIGLVYGALTFFLWGIVWAPPFEVPLKNCYELGCTVEFIVFFPPAISSQLFNFLPTHGGFPLSRGDAEIISSLFIGALVGGIAARVIGKVKR